MDTTVTAASRHWEYCWPGVRLDLMFSLARNTSPEHEAATRAASAVSSVTHSGLDASIAMSRTRKAHAAGLKRLRWRYHTGHCFPGHAHSSSSRGEGNVAVNKSHSHRSTHN